MLEGPLRDLLASQLSVLEEGLTLVDIERYIPSALGTRSFIDILARDARGKWVLVELKRSEAASREAIHEIYKYVEAVKEHLGARDDEIRALLVSTDWRELLRPFSRFIHDTSIAVKGIHISVDPASNEIAKQDVEPLPIVSGRILSPWHEISLYENEDRLAQGIASHDKSCRAKGINDYVMVVLRAPDEHYEKSVIFTVKALHSIDENHEDVTEDEIRDTAAKMERMDHMIYFVPQLQTADEYLDIIRSSPSLYEEAREFPESMHDDELLNALQDYALGAEPKVDRDYFEIGYPAKFRCKILEDEGWRIEKILRRGAFERNEVLSDETILNEICGEAGTSKQGLERSIRLADNAEFSQLLKDITRCLQHNTVWAGMIRDQLEEARKDFPEGDANITISSPSTGVMTIFFAITQEDGVSHLPWYSIACNQGEHRRRYIGELVPIDDATVQPVKFAEVLEKYYHGDIRLLLLTMSCAGYETRDSEVLDDLNLTYSSFRCDIEGQNKTFFRRRNNRWREVQPIEPFGEFRRYLQANPDLLRVVFHKLSPRIGLGMWDGTSADGQLQEFVDAASAQEAQHYLDPPTRCDICGIPSSVEEFMCVGRLRENDARATMCADCTIYYASEIGPGVGQVYRKQDDGRWLLVGPGSSAPG